MIKISDKGQKSQNNQNGSNSAHVRNLIHLDCNKTREKAVFGRDKKTPAGGAGS